MASSSLHMVTLFFIILSFTSLAFTYQLSSTNTEAITTNLTPRNESSKLVEFIPAPEFRYPDLDSLSLATGTNWTLIPALPPPKTPQELASSRSLIAAAMKKAVIRVLPNRAKSQTDPKPQAKVICEADFPSLGDENDVVALTRYFLDKPDYYWEQRKNYQEFASWGTAAFSVYSVPEKYTYSFRTIGMMGAHVCYNCWAPGNRIGGAFIFRDNYGEMRAFRKRGM
ncbi:hypothetical protein B9Z19DRAFT_1063154 [Tuber borchii]|uniref:Uncharacterized protein n=1 Tax=Tuber borchii TaxID=42251 RepID=A0A2T6ZZ87_TUBBO|nr:hypothetical protein B9Z19DRAFT_1063154 [Tuber borchii]